MQTPSLTWWVLVAADVRRRNSCSLPGLSPDLDGCRPPPGRVSSLSNALRLACCALISAVLLPMDLRAADETAPAAPSPALPAETNAIPADLLRHYLELQGQLHIAQQAIERNRQEAADAATRNAESIAARIQDLEKTLTGQRETERRQLDEANRLIFLIGGGCVALGFIAMLLTAYFQWRTVGRLTEFSMVSQASLTLGRNALPAGVETASTAIEQSNGRLNDVLARIEQRIRELEHTAHPPLGDGTISIGETISASTSAAPPPKPQRISVLIAKGQSLLDLDKPEEALAVFNDILALDAGHTDTLVKKGDTLERLGRLDESVACYDAAIAADATFTIAYLHKGGLFNRMDRHEDALKCYEEALRTQEKSHAA